ncbi:MAG: hypothetical protein GWP19_12215 [Planctomycetia bacterium]|nr:hypothetical protein [Planctomycetia bacterium]
MKPKSIVSQYQLFLNRLRFAVSIEKTKRFFRVILFIRYKKFIFLFRVILTLISLFTALIVFQTRIYALGFSLLIYLLTTAFEKIIFSYRTMYIHSFPAFELKQEKWLACYFGYAETYDKSTKFPIIGLGLSDYEYSKSIHQLFLQWTFGKSNDVDKSLSISVVVMADSYVFFIYPNIKKKKATEFYNQAESEHKKESLTDVHHHLSMLQVMGKRFDLSKDSFFHRFREIYVPGEPCFLQLYLYNKNNQLEHIADLTSITVHNFKIKQVSHLTRRDIEYDMFKNIN